jgi:hypothetical protein
VGPPAPLGLTLAAGSDSGSAGDNVTNVTAPVIGGTGEPGDTVRLFDGNTAAGSGLVGTGGLWSVTAGPLSPGVHSLTASESDALGDVSGLSAALALTIDTSAPVTAPGSLNVLWNALATPIGIAAPSDGDNPAAALGVTVTGLPGNGTVTLDGTTPVSVGESLTVAELGGLEFTPNVNGAGSFGTFSYRVADPAGNSSSGSAQISVSASSTTTLYGFVFTYSDGKDYYYGTVADNGTFGVKLGALAPAGASGHYDIFAALGTTSEAPGTVSVSYYSHDGPGQGSAEPAATAAGLFDGTAGLGSEADAILGSDGTQYAFSAGSAANVPHPIALYGFTFTYSDNAAFYTGTVADDGSFATAVGAKPAAGGTYTIFADGTTTRPAGTVVIEHFDRGAASYVPLHAGAGAVDGTAGLGSEHGTITLRDAAASELGFGPGAEPDLAAISILDPPPPAPGDGDPLATNGSGQLELAQVVNGALEFTPIGGIGPEWELDGRGDLLGDGASGFLMRNTGTVIPGALYVGEVENGRAVYTPVGGVGPEWQFAGVGDLLSDGRVGFLMRNTGHVIPGTLEVGEVVSGHAVYTPIGGVGPEWQFEGVGDFLGDGHSGFLMRNTGTVIPGALAVGEVAGGQLTFHDIGTLGAAWQVVGTGPYVDAHADIMLRDGSSGAVEIGSVTDGTLAYTTVGSAGPEWNFHAANPATRP